MTHAICTQLKRVSVLKFTMVLIAVATRSILGSPYRFSVRLNGIDTEIKGKDENEKRLQLCKRFAFKNLKQKVILKNVALENMEDFCRCLYVVHILTSG